MILVARDASTFKFEVKIPPAKKRARSKPSGLSDMLEGDATGRSRGDRDSVGSF